jgi:hypothetical protein
MYENHPGTISLPKVNPYHRLALAVGVTGVALIALLMPLAGAHAALLNRVNEATRDAAAQVTAARTEAFMQGVFIGHYTTYNQLVGAISWHKEQGTLPSFSATAPAVVTQCINGDVVSFAGSSTTDGTISVRGDLKTGADNTPQVVTKTLQLGANQYAVAIERSVGIGSNVTVCTADSFYSQWGHITLD